MQSKSHRIKEVRARAGFTIVELLIVIVVIGILAAITIIAYNGISNKATVASLQSDLENSNKQMLAYLTTSSTGYPTAIDCSASPAANTICLKSSSNTTYQFSVDNSSLSSPSYCITATNGTKSYYIGTSVSSPTVGGCPGHGIGGTAAITNLVTNPSFETNLNGWNYSTFGTGGAATGARTAGSAFSGSYFLRATYSIAATSGYLILGPQIANSPDLTATSTDVYTMYVRPSVTVTANPTVDFYIKSSTTFVSTVTGSAVSCPANQWTRLSMTVTVPATATTGRMSVNAAAAQFGSSGYIDVDGAMNTDGSTVYNFADGNTANWIWNGTANLSQSTGPQI